MSLWQIAARSVWQNRGRYAAYLGSAAFAVMIYFLYSALIFHPDLQGGYRGATYALQGMKGAAVVIALFTFLFMLYSNSAFVRSRMKEFGLLTLLGLSRSQLVWLILLESLLIGAVAIGSGLGLGLLFLKLFFMAISALLRLPEQIPFYAGPRVWGHTLLVFGSFFVLVSLASLRGVLRRNIVELVRAGRQPKANPTFSRRKAVAGLLLIIGGYAWASIPHPTVVVIAIVPVTTVVSIGTYLLMREGSIAFLSWLHRRDRFFYRPSPFLSVSQLVYKMQDNYRVLSAVALLVAVILTAVSTVFAMYLVVGQMALDSTPHAIQLLQRPGADPAAAVGQVEAVLRKHGVSGLTFRELVTRTGKLGDEEVPVTLVPYSFYAAVERAKGERLPLAGTGEAIRVYPYFVRKGYRLPVEPKADYLVVDGERIPLQVRADQSGRALNYLAAGDDTLVLDDSTFAALLERTPVAQQVHLALWNGPGWKSRAAQRAVAELRTLFPYGGPVELTTTAEAYLGSVSTMGIGLFIGIFISLVFFAACFSLLYFRLFTEIDEDRKYFRRLAQLGLSTRELKRLALVQAAVLFFVPFLAGLLHMTFAMQALGTITGEVLLHVGWGVALVYLILYAIAFRATGAFYWKSLQAGLAERTGIVA